MHAIERIWIGVLFVLCAFIGFYAWVVYTGWAEARIRIRHNLDKQFFSLIQTRVDEKRIELGQLPEAQSTPISALITENARELFPKNRDFKLTGVYVAREGSRALIYRGRLDDGPALLKATLEKSYKTLLYDPTNGPESAGYDLLELTRPQ